MSGWYEDDFDEEVVGFVRRINRRAANVRTNTELTRRAAAREMLQEVVFDTPVDTGRARSNWQVGNGYAPDTYLDAYAPGNFLGLSETSNAIAAIDAGESVINASTPDVPIFIANPAPYIDLLNEGRSKQAGAGFIQRALARGQARARRASLLEPSVGN